MVKLYKLYINDVSARILQTSQKYYTEYNNQIFPNNSNINIIAFDAVSSYHFPYPITGSKIREWDCILNCCDDFYGIDAPDL